MVIGFFILSTFLSVFVLPNIISLQNLPNNQPDLLRIVIVASLGLIIAWIAIIPAVLQIAGKRIWLENDLIYFTNKPVIGKFTTNLVELNKLREIRTKQNTFNIFSLQIAFPVFLNRLVFIYKDKKKEEVKIDGWDIGTIKCLLFYIKGKYPYIAQNTHLYRDPPEYLAGLKEILETSQKH